MADLWSAVYGYNVNNIRKYMYGSILTRDRQNTSADDLSSFAPFTAGGGFTTGLLVQDGGTWHDLGAGSSDGPSFMRNLEVSKTKIWQSRTPARSDVTSDEGSFKFGICEASELSDDLEFDLALDSAGGYLGEPGYAKTKPNETVGRERQIVALGVDRGGHYICEVFPRVSIAGFEDVNWNPEDPVVLNLTWDIFICPDSGFSHKRFREGEGWRSLSDDDS